MPQRFRRGNERSSVGLRKRSARWASAMPAASGGSIFPEPRAYQNDGLAVGSPAGFSGDAKGSALAPCKGALRPILTRSDSLAGSLPSLAASGLALAFCYPGLRPVGQGLDCSNPVLYCTKQKPVKWLVPGFCFRRDQSKMSDFAIPQNGPRTALAVPSYQRPQKQRKCSLAAVQAVLVTIWQGTLPPPNVATLNFGETASKLLTNT